MSFENRTTEEKTIFDVMNLRPAEAIELIRKRGLVDRVIWKDGVDIPKTDPCYISHRISLKILKGKIVSAMIG